MIINYNHDDYEIEVKSAVCDYHKKNSGRSYAGCTCVSSYALVRKGINQAKKGETTKVKNLDKFLDNL